jgi:hypothetical protein
MAADLIELRPEGRLRLHLHPGQSRAWDSERRFIAVLAGTQGGKTSFGPLWLYREIQLRGPGDYLVVTPTFPLLELKALLEFKRLFQQTLKVGEATGVPRKFTFSEDGALRTFGHVPDVPTQIFFGHASDPDSLESATAKAAWLDEAGQKKFRLGSWEAIQRRLSIHQGRALITTTPYDLGWLKQKLWDPWKAGDPDIDVVRFDSTENPAFPPEEFERARRQLPPWKFDLFYRAVFTRPAGLIYDAFDETRHKVPRFELPPQWPRYLGLDFGGVNTVGVFYAMEPGTGRLFAYREYRAGGRTAKEHVAALRNGEPRIPTCVGGSRSEGQWRDEFCAAGLPVQEPAVTEVEVGIDRVYGAHKRDEILVFEDLPGYLEEKLSYSRKTDDAGEPTEEIEDKNAFHHMDAERYIVSYLRRPAMRLTIGLPGGRTVEPATAGEPGDKVGKIEPASPLVPVQLFRAGGAGFPRGPFGKPGL